MVRAVRDKLSFYCSFAHTNPAASCLKSLGQACPPALLSATLMPDLTRLPSHWPSWAHRLCPRETLVAPAATGSPPWSAFAIELKPKCGVWSLRGKLKLAGTTYFKDLRFWSDHSSSFRPPDPVSQQVIPACAFSLQQRIKRPNPSLRSTYCPLALFSSQVKTSSNGWVRESADQMPSPV